MTAIILAAGYGTRLYPLTLDKPKAFLRVGGKSILDRLFEKIGEIKSTKKAVIVTNDKFYKSFKDWSESRTYLFQVRVINDRTTSDRTRLGAIGDINLVLKEDKTDDDILVTGSDNLFEKGLTGFVKFGIEKRPFSSVGLFDVKEKSLAVKYGICELRDDARVVGFEEKPKLPKTTLAASALYFIPKERIKKIFEYMETTLSKDAPGNLIKWLSKEDRVFGYTLQGKWYDIGDGETLKKADREFRIKD